MPVFRRLATSFLLIALATIAGLLSAGFSLTGTVMLYLLAVVACSYFLGFSASIFAAVCSFLAINYFFIEPRYTFEVANAESWTVLIGFLAVSLVVASLVHRLRNQTFRAEQARKRAEHGRIMSERLASVHDEEQVLSEGCRLLHETLRRPVGIALPDAGGESFRLVQQLPETEVKLDQRAAKWCCANARMMGPGSGNWPELGIWLMPFERLPGIFPVLIVMNAVEDMDEITYLRGLLDQLATAWQRVCQGSRAAQAEIMAQQEAAQNALLASISHDMRTPLTAILGAVTALQAQRTALAEEEQVRLLTSIRSEAQHLADNTENILALSRLQFLDKRSLALDWQAPEEIIGALLQRYRQRTLLHEVRSEVPQEVPLIRADATLLIKALGNLLDNALAAHCGLEPVWIGAESHGHEVALWIRDRGKGFPPGFSPEHLRKFQRLEDGGKGLGLGLVIVETIARLHGAELHMTAREGGGSYVALVFQAASVGDKHG